MFVHPEKGWYRGLSLIRFFTVGRRHLVHVSIDLQEAAYDGEMKNEGSFWTLAGESDGKGERLSYTLDGSLTEALARLPRDELAAAVVAAPADFAQAITYAHGHPRIAAVFPGSLGECILRDLGHGAMLVPPSLVDGVFCFQLYKGRGLNDREPNRLWACRASLDGTLLDKQLLLTTE